MTNVRRPIHLQLRPASLAVATATGLAGTPLGGPFVAANTPTTCHSPKALSPTSDSLPSQIIPHLFVGNQEQTNRETVNRLNISYILSLGLLPIISSSSPTSPNTTTTNNKIPMPSQNCSIDFKIRVRANNTPATSQPSSAAVSPATGITTTTTMPTKTDTPDTGFCPQPPRPLTRSATSGGHHFESRDENKGVKSVRSVHCKCINIADNCEQSLGKFFDEAHAFIDEARRKKCNILVHCLAGISRSPTIAIAYLMRVNSLRLKEAYNLVKQCRPQIDPNLNFMGQLMIYDRTLRENEHQQHQTNVSIDNGNSDTSKIMTTN